jgi:methylenetetrahydrofolate dehydrogenase (NADP+) / methenyltetrahydrofolate cyclohydrolase
MILLDGKVLSAKIRGELKNEAAGMLTQGIVPHLGVILVGEFVPSVIYVRNKETACAEVGIKTQTLKLKDNTTEKELLGIIEEWNKDKNTHGILVQMPLPKGIDEQKVLDSIKPYKDIDGLSTMNLGRLVSGDAPYFYPCTPLGIIELITHYGISIEGKHCVIVGRGKLVGKPLANILLQKDHKLNATVTICHSKTINIGDYTRQADILIVAIGQANFITKEMVKLGAVVVDVGTNRININEQKTKLVGDVEFDTVKDIVSAISPVPGGVGPMTIAMLLKNTINAAKIQFNKI